MTTNLPTYASLPIDTSKPAHSAWGVFGTEDEVGTINLLTPERVRRAAALVRKGRVFSLNWDLEMPNPPILGRRALKHTITDLAPIVHPGTDDHYDSFWPQASSQWDALSHMAHPEYGYYNGRTIDDITGRPGSRNGIDNWGRRGIAGRFVLADVEAYYRSQGRSVDNSQQVVVTVDDVDATLEYQGVSLEDGDILLLRFGWIGWYETTSPATREWLAAQPYFPAPGLSREDCTLAWLWDHHLAAVAADCPTVESLPPDVRSVDGFLHYHMIPLLGLAVGELFVLDALAQHCATDRVYEGLFTAAPLNKIGGSGSPANALAIK